MGEAAFGLFVPGMVAITGGMFRLANRPDDPAGGEVIFCLGDICLIAAMGLGIGAQS